MTNKTQLEKRIEAVEKEIEMLRSDLARKESYLQGLREAARFVSKDENDSHIKPAELRANTDMARARDLLRKVGHPLHVDEILKGLGKEINRTNRASVAGSIASYAHKGQFFTKTAPATFGLVEFGQTAQHTSATVSIKTATENGAREGYTM